MLRSWTPQSPYSIYATSPPRHFRSNSLLLVRPVQLCFVPYSARNRACDTRECPIPHLLALSQTRLVLAALEDGAARHHGAWGCGVVRGFDMIDCWDEVVHSSITSHHHCSHRALCCRRDVVSESDVSWREGDEDRIVDSVEHANSGDTHLSLASSEMRGI